MIPLINLKGYFQKDPLDKASGFMPYALLMSVNFILTVILLNIILLTGIVQFNGFTILGLYFPPFWTSVLEVITNTLIYSAIIVYLRKSSSLIHYLVVFIPYFLIDLYLTGYVRGVPGAIPLWTYGSDSFISSIKIPLLQFILTNSADGILFGIIGLFIARIIASIIYKNKVYPVTPDENQYNKLFSKEWSQENVYKPKRDAAYWVLRLLGFGYIVYLSILLLGILGGKSWPDQIANLIKMTNENPALAINTYFKILLMTSLAFLGAYNINLRYHASIGLIVGHSISTIYCLAFYFFDKGNDYSQFLFISGIVDGVMVLLFIWILIKYRKNGEEFKPENDFPIFFSIPATLMNYLFKVLGIALVLFSLLVLAIRLFTDGSSGISAVYGYPDPMVGNTIILYGTLGLISLLLVKRDKLRNSFFSLIFFPLAFGSIVFLLWIIVGNFISTVSIAIRDYVIVDGVKQHLTITIDWYFVLYALVYFIIASVMIIFRKMYYNVDYAITTLNPSTSRNIIALTNAFFNSDAKHDSEVLQSIDQYMGGMRGRKRGLLNLPFALLENIFNWLFWLHPPFSSMSREEQRYFFWKYFCKNEIERNKSFIPLLTDFAYQIGLSLNSMIMFAHFSQTSARNSVGYVPIDARDRTQGDCASYDPPFNDIAKLPVDEKDPANFKSSTSGNCKTVAPRVTTVVKEDETPSEVDYLIIGSGAGGAAAAYRLACSVPDPSKIVVVERGYRYQPLQDFSDSEIDMMKKIYKEGGLQQTKKFTLSVLQGECVGGTTVANNAVCFKIPDKIKNLWENDYGIKLDKIDAEYEKIAGELDIKPLGDPGINKIVKEKFFSGVNNYNSTVPAEERLIYDGAVNVNHLNNVGDGNWNLGNKRMRKRSMLETFLPWAESRGVKVVSNLTAVRFVASHKKNTADYVILRTDNGILQRVKIRKAVIIAGGVIASSHFLMRSEVKNINIGRNMSCNFAFPLTFEYEDVLKAFDGEQITLAASDPQSRAIFETYFNPPAAFALASVPFIFDRRNSIMNRYQHLINFGTLIGSESNGVILKRADIINGQAFDWKLGPKDIDNIKYAFTTLIKLGQLSGSRKVILPTKPGLELDLNNKTEVENFIKAFKDFPLRMTDLFINTAHPQGGNLMAGSNSQHKNLRVIDEDFRLVNYDNVFVADASLFPTSLTVNPQWTIMALSSLAAKSVLKNYS